MRNHFRSSAGGFSEVSPCGRRPDSASNGQSTIAMSDNNEAQGGRAVSSDIRRCNVVTQSKPLTNTLFRKKPALKYAATRQGNTSMRRHGLNTFDGEQDDIKEAISRSLADNTVPPSTTRLTAPKTEKQYEADIAKARIMSLAIDDEPPLNTSSRNRHGPASASSSVVPHAPLHSLHEDLDRAAEDLENSTRKLDPAHVADCVRRWEGTVSEVLHAIGATETRRVEDIRMRLDFDRAVERKHQKKLLHMNQTWQKKMHEKEKKWEERMEDQKRMYEAQLAEARSTTPASPTKRKLNAGDERTEYTERSPKKTKNGHLK